MCWSILSIVRLPRGGRDSDAFAQAGDFKELLFAQPSNYLLTRGARGSSFPRCEAPSVGKSFTPADLTWSPKAAK